MALLKGVEAALKKPAVRWWRFLKDILGDILLIAVSLWFANAITTNEWVPSTPLDFKKTVIEGTVLGLMAVALLFWRGLYSINVRYVGLGDFLNIVVVGTLAACGLVIIDKFHLGAMPRAGVLTPYVLFGFSA